ncbi:MAG: hypothetical protein IT580_10525, partial [Verrucomicrobiales bacterium]|nr:hypothetical protein [Verrucomicrobiales bacterium]
MKPSPGASWFRRAWSLTWRIGVAVVLLAWAFHAIFHDQVRRLLDEQRIVLDAMPRAERWAVVWRMGPTHLWGTILQVDR